MSVKSKATRAVLVWVLREADPETKMQMQVVYLEGSPRNHWLGSGEVSREGKEATTGCDNKHVTTCVPGRAIPGGTLGDRVKHVPEVFSQWAEVAGTFLHQLASAIV